MVHGSGRKQKGLTLLEVLIALVLTSYIVTLLGQILLQSMRVEQSLETGRFEQSVLRLRVGMLRESIRSAIPVRVGAGLVFEGQGSALRFQSVASPYESTGAVGSLEISFRYDSSSDSSGLYVRLIDQAESTMSAATSATKLLGWPGRKGYFRYLDHQGQWHADWIQTPTSERRVLPVAVAIETGLPEWPRLLVQVDASAVPPPTLKELESL